MLDSNSKLITIVVISHNSSTFILECLESIKAQTHQAIELIVSDDCSSDNTFKLAREWLDLNVSRFTESSTILASDVNVGITKNANKGLLRAKGTFVKLLAADDTLAPCALIDLTTELQRRGAPYCFSQVAPLTNQSELRLETRRSFLARNKFTRFARKDPEAQYRSLLRNTEPHTLIVGALFATSYLRDLNFLDETYAMMEDYPLLVKISGRGDHLILLDKVTAYYRVKETTEVFSKRRQPRYSLHWHDLKNFRTLVIKPELKRKRLFMSLLYVNAAERVTQLSYVSDCKAAKLLVTLARIINEKARITRN